MSRCFSKLSVKIGCALISIIVAVTGIFTVSSAAAELPPEISSQAAVVMDAKTGQVLYGKNIDGLYFPASTTKIMTILLALENCEDLSETVTANYSAVNSEVVPRDTSHIALVDGEQMALKDLLYATMMVSANDAANVIAEHVSGSVSEFAKLMTERAAELGCLKTTFTNANGLPDDYHMTSAYDLALIAKAALQNDDFRSVFGKILYSIPPTNKNVERSFATLHEMLKSTSSYYYSPTTGGKGGWTEAAQYTLVTSAEKNGTELICVLLKSPSAKARYNDTEALFDYCFDNFERKEFSTELFGTVNAKVISGDYEIGSAVIRLESNVSLLVHKDTDVTGLNFTKNIPSQINEGDTFTTELTIPENPYMFASSVSVPLSIAVTEYENPVPLIEQEEPKTTFLDVLKVIGIILLVIVATAIMIFVLMLIYMRQEQKKRAEKRRLQKQKLEEERNRKRNIRFYD